MAAVGALDNMKSLKLYLSRQANSPGHCVLEQLIPSLFGRIPYVFSIRIRGVA